jgi:sulfotransferase
MSKTYFFLSGLPRSGQTLLSTILNQNPDIHSGPESPLCNLITNCFINLENTEQYWLYPKKDLFKKFAKALADSYYDDVNSQYIIDKCRVWNSRFNIELIKNNLNPQVKIICCVRDVLEVLSSYIKLVNNTNQKSFVDDNLTSAGMEINDENRCKWLMSENGLINLSLKCISETYKLPEIYLMEYNDLVSNPANVIKGIYNFLELPFYQHTFTNLKNNLQPNDDLLGLPTLHYVRKDIIKISIPPSEILPQSIINKYNNMEIWK